MKKPTKLKRQSHHTILIICEGENTEPLFFNSIRDAILDGQFNIGNIEIKIRPEPKQEEVQSGGKNQSQRKERRTKFASVGKEPNKIEAPLPLKWVLEAQEELKDGTFNEAWVVFDHDDHPARKEAFERADDVINGTSVKIAFSSRSFEYYLLLHFERVFKRFNTSECRDKNNVDANKRKNSIACGTNKHADDCLGQKCIGGYARSKGFWLNSKSSQSTFHLIKDKLEIGFENCAWLRHMSEIFELKKMIYDRNPYTTVDALVKRLTGYEDTEWVWLGINSPYNYKDIELVVDPNKEVIIKNKSGHNFLLGSDHLNEIKTDSTYVTFGVNNLIDPGTSKRCPVFGHDSSWFMLKLENYRFMFDFNEQKAKDSISMEFADH